MILWIFVISAFVLGRLFAQRSQLSIELWLVLVALGFEAAGFAVQRTNTVTQTIGLCTGTAILSLVAVASEVSVSSFPPPLLVKLVSMAAYFGSIVMVLWIPLRGEVRPDNYRRLAREVVFTCAFLAIPIGGAFLAGERDFQATLPSVSAETFVALVGVICFVYGLTRFRHLDRRLIWASAGVGALTTIFGLLIRTPWYLALCCSIAIVGAGSAAAIAASIVSGRAEAVPLTS